MTNWIERWFVDEPSNEGEPCLKIKTGNGPFAYRNADLDDVKEFLQKEIDLAVAEAKKESIMALDKKVMQGFNKALKTQSSQLIEMIRRGERERIVKMIKMSFTTLTLPDGQVRDFADRNKLDDLLSHLQDVDKDLKK